MAIHATASAGAQSRAIIGAGSNPVTLAAPPPFVQYVRAVLVSEHEGDLGVDIRAADTRTVWMMEVSSDLPDTEIALSWPDLSRVPRDLRPMLVDETTGKRTYMRTSTGYAYTTGETGDTRRFTVDLSPSNQSGLVISGVAAAGLAGGGADIRVNLSSAASVTADVLNIAGRRVANVCQDRACEPGLNTLSWNGRSSSGSRLPYGRYMVRVTARAEDGQQVSSTTALEVRGR